ncbi:MAG TPA: hypothetical protein VGR92_16030 [Steroidobacteraceae bacterium]|nr:hypothetical protein [Steroidobacteraceae bacterium]
MPQTSPYVRYSLLSMAVLAAVAGGAVAYIASSFTIRTIGLILLLISVYLGVLLEEGLRHLKLEREE